MMTTTGKTWRNGAKQPPMRREVTEAIFALIGDELARERDRFNDNGATMAMVSAWREQRMAWRNHHMDDEMVQREIISWDGLV